MCVQVNGFPKCGNHAVKKGIELLGVIDVEINHRPYSDVMPWTFTGQLVMPIRHPRNVLISKCRWEHRPLCSGSLIGFVRKFDHEPMQVEYGAFLPWMRYARVLTVRYEELVSSATTLRTIASFLQVPFLTDAFPNLPGITYSWNATPSRWEDHWSPALDRVWADEGMTDLEGRLGY